MKIIGVTGGIGSGKSTVCRIMSDLGAKVVDADAISRRIMDKGSLAYCEVKDFFGAGILREDGEIDRKSLADIVFADKQKLDRLNEITHKYIFAEMRRQIAESDNAEAIVLDVPLLFDDDFEIEYDVSVAIIAEDEIRIKRAMMRDGADEKRIRDRIRNQISNSELALIADYTIENNSDEEELYGKVEELYNRIVVK